MTDYDIAIDIADALFTEADGTKAFQLKLVDDRGRVLSTWSYDAVIGRIVKLIRDKDQPTDVSEVIERQKRQAQVLSSKLTSREMNRNCDIFCGDSGTEKPSTYWQHINKELKRLGSQLRVGDGRGNCGSDLETD